MSGTRTDPDRSRYFCLIVYRLTRQRYSALDGEGARRVGGRCNKIGTPAVYTSEHASLAVLEVLVHIDKSELPRDYVLMAVEIENHEIPAGTAEAARAAGASKRHPVFRVPSIVVPCEANYILYPHAPGLRARILFIEPFSFDSRLFLPVRVIK
ncbi:MAG TPA: RES domain-containing protein [Bryobacteraceae bacterium]|nr:RES domain-containing protein [Bryobacteraceae bacterium]